MKEGNTTTIGFSVSFVNIEFFFLIGLDNSRFWNQV